jgi:hypothetical protein
MRIDHDAGKKISRISTVGDYLFADTALIYNSDGDPMSITIEHDHQSVLTLLDKFEDLLEPHVLSAFRHTSAHDLSYEHVPTSAIRLIHSKTKLRTVSAHNSLVLEEHFGFCNMRSTRYVRHAT